MPDDVNPSDATNQQDAGAAPDDTTAPVSSPGTDPEQSTALSAAKGRPTYHSFQQVKIHYKISLTTWHSFRWISLSLSFVMPEFRTLHCLAIL